MPLIQDPDLASVLMDADVDDLGILIDHITDKGEGRISLAASSCAALMRAKESGQVGESARALIVEELSRFAGNSLMNLFRGGGGVSYREIARDVADHLKASHHAGSDVAALEMAILEKLTEQSLSKMSENEKVEFFKQFGIPYAAGSGVAVAAGLVARIVASNSTGYQLSTLIANGVVKALLGRGLGVSLGSVAGSAALVAPVTLALSVIWGLYGLTSPAYRITVPCVIHLAYMRRKREFANACRRCGAPPAAGARFCNSCGAPLAQHPALPYSASSA
ncbi:hypothetical protein [Janthinobacterium sp. 78]|uniref:hypothetical protein n=1 Tax=Janthinobacterium sp. 78 TaxID=2135631 RepID=UPI000D5C8C29|nr:hypothetical protein [Janthinobacterium sp. 78]PVX38177.1 uncharacterized protein YaaW (UPF0174 family) [Janthinobacterium sp. 78]